VFAKAAVLDIDITKLNVCGLETVCPPYKDGSTVTLLAFNDEFTIMFYRHPSLSILNKILHSVVYDLYFPSIVLLEVAYWRPVDALLDIDLKKNTPAEIQPQVGNLGTLTTNHEHHFLLSKLHVFIQLTAILNFSIHILQ
jgi:hypothetical protein